MRSRSEALLPPDPHTGPHVAAVEGTHAELGLRCDEIAHAFGTKVSTLHGWRAGDTGPSPARPAGGRA